jgi:FkbH-like protein
MLTVVKSDKRPGRMLPNPAKSGASATGPDSSCGSFRAVQFVRIHRRVPPEHPTRVLHSRCLAGELALDLPLGASESEVQEALEQRIGDLRGLWRFARHRFGAQVIQQTLLTNEPELFGSFEAMVPASPVALTERMNAAMREAARQDGVLLLDLALYARNSGCPVQFTDPVRWHHAKQLISPALAPLYGDLLARVAAAIAGLSRKCLVLDLDNTVWGGVVGDDGIEGIRIGQGSAEGEAYVAFQRHLVRLARRGIVLAVCSKNDSETAEAAFRDRNEMVLRREDIAAFVCNWDDKAANMRAIARRLDLGLDSMVFVDDNPAERDIIRRELPEVAVPELPDDVAHYPSLLARAGYFEAASFTQEDAVRTQSYALDAQRRAELARATDLDGYRKGLAMAMTATRVSPANFSRVLQLINKTNQFNLSTRRYIEGELQRLIQEQAVLPLCLSLRDRFGNNGLISVILARPDPVCEPDELLIDTWLMSCRVLGRQVEAAALEVLATEARRSGMRGLIGEYRPTLRNNLVSDHYAKLGFTAWPPPAAAAAGASFWRYDLTDGPRPQHFIEWEITP